MSNDLTPAADERQPDDSMRFEFGYCVECGRAQTNEEAIAGDVCSVCDGAVAQPGEERP